MFTHYEDMKGDKNVKIGVVWEGHRGHRRSSETSPFDRAHVTFYSTVIETIPFSSYSAFFVETDQFYPTPRAFVAPAWNDPVRISP